MTETEKLILDGMNTQFSAMNQQFTVMNQRFSAIDDQFTVMNQRFSAIDDQFTVMNQRFSAIDDQFTVMNQRFSAIDDQFLVMNRRLDKMEQADEKLATEVTRLGVLLENDISKKIDIIGEGHDFLIQRLNGALQTSDRWEDTSLRVINLQMDLNKVKLGLSTA